MIKKFLSKIFVVILSGLFFSQAVFAAGNVSVTMANPDPYSENKSWFFFEYKEGQVLEDAVLVKNFGRKEVTVQIYAVDATSNEAGSFVLKFPKDEQKAIGKWAHVKSSAVKLGPGAAEEVPFTLEVPEGVSPGQYFGGIVVQEVEEKKSEEVTTGDDSIGATINTRVGSRVYLTVPGEVITDFRWKNFSHIFEGGNRYFNFEFENNGNISIVPEVVLTFTNIFGREVAKTSHELGASLPATKIEPLVSWDDVPFFGKYTVDADLVYYRQDAGQAEKAEGVKLAKRLTVWVIPWVELSVLVVILILIFGFLGWRSYSFNQLKESAELYTVKEGDNIKDLAARVGVSWKTLVKLNGLEAPYVLEEGRRILLPGKKI